MPRRKSKKNNDFQKVKFKVGKKLPKADNYTSTAFKSKSIVVKQQLKVGSHDELQQHKVKKSRSPQELFSHLHHYNPSFRLNSLNTIKAIMRSDPQKLRPFIGSVVDQVMALIWDPERDIRAAAVECLTSVFHVVNQESIQAFLPTIIAHQLCAMTHIKDDIKFDSIKVLHTLISVYPSLLCGFVYKLALNFLDLISTVSTNSKRILKVSPSSKLSTAQWRQQAFSTLQQLLSIKVSTAHPTSSKPSHAAITIDNHDSVSTPSEATRLRGLIQCDIDDCMFLSLNQLEKVKWRHKEVDTDINDEEQFLANLVKELLPLIRESWVETVSGSSRDRHDSLLCLVGTLGSLHQLVLLPSVKQTQKLQRSLMEEVKYLLSYEFPVQGIQGPFSGQAQTKKRRGYQSTGPDVAQVNLKLSILAHHLQCSTDSTRKYLRRHILSTAASDLSDDSLAMLRGLQHDDVIMEFIGSLIHDGSGGSDGSTEHTVFTLRILHDSISPSYTRMGDDLLEYITLLADSQPASNTEVCLLLLSALIKGLQMRVLDLPYKLYNKLLMKASSSVSDDSSFVSRSDCLKIAISLTYHLTEVNRSSLLLMRDLMAAPLLLSAELMNLLLSGVADRYNHGLIQPADYMSFLCSALTGKADPLLDSQTLSHVSSILTPSIALHICTGLANSSQVIQLANHFFMQVLKEFTDVTSATLLATACTPLRLSPQVLQRALYYILQGKTGSSRLSDDDLATFLRDSLRGRSDVCEIFHTEVKCRISASASRTEKEELNEILNKYLSYHLYLL